MSARPAPKVRRLPRRAFRSTYPLLALTLFGFGCSTLSRKELHEYSHDVALALETLAPCSTLSAAEYTKASLLQRELYTTSKAIERKTKE